MKILSQKIIDWVKSLDEEDGYNPSIIKGKKIKSDLKYIKNRDFLIELEYFMRLIEFLSQIRTLNL